MSFGSVRSLLGISFHIFAPITEKDFRLISGLILIRKIVRDLRDLRDLSEQSGTFLNI